MKVKEMPDNEKYAKILGYEEVLDTFFPPLGQKYLGKDGMTEVLKLWNEGIKPIPEDASMKDKYELAYANWIWRWSTAFEYFKKHTDQEGIEEFKRAAADTLKKKNSGLAVTILNIIRAISPGYAFTMIVKQMAYEFQVFSPFSISEMDSQKAVFHTPNCHVLDFKGAEYLCTIGCQIIFPTWIAELFRVNYKTDRKDSSCTITLTPLK